MKIVVVLLAAFAYYLILATQVTMETSIAAAVLAIVALASELTLRAGSFRTANFSWRHLGVLLRAATRIPADTARIGVKLVGVIVSGGSPALAVATPFRYGTMDDADERARRATAIVAGSLTPDTIIVDAEPDESKALTHRLLASHTPDRPEWLA